MLFGPKKLPKIPYDLVSYIQIETEAIRPYDGLTPRYENTRKSKFHHNKRSNL